MNFSESEAKLSAYPPESSGSDDDTQFSKSTNQPELTSQEKGKGEMDSDKKNDLIVYDLEEFKEAKKDWIRNFFYSKKNELKKLIGYKEIDNGNSEKKELKDADNPANKLLQPDKEALFLKGRSELQSLQPTLEELQINKEINSERFKRIRVDLINFNAATKKHIKVFLRTTKSANTEYTNRKEGDLKSFSEKQKHSVTGTSLNHKVELKSFFQSFKQETREHFDLRKEDIREFFNTKSAETEKIIRTKNEDLKNADCSEKSKNAAAKFINSEQKKITEFVSKNEKIAKKQIKEMKLEFDVRTNSGKKLLRKLIKPDKLNTAQLHALIESNKQVMKDFIESQKDILQSYFDSNKAVLQPQSFRNIEQIKTSISGTSEYASPAIVPQTSQKTLKKSLKILLAEDDLLLRKSLSFYLSHNGFEIVQVTNGLEAMEEIHKTKFDVLILDLQMPHMGGLEIIDRVRNQLHLETKIIVLTASGVEDVELKSFSMGATDFISKPFSPSVVKARIEKIMESNTD